MLFEALVLFDVMSDFNLVKSSGKFVSSTVRLNIFFWSPAPSYPPPNPGCQTKLKNEKIVGAVWVIYVPT